MAFIFWAIFELLSYGPIFWLVSIALVYVFARYCPWGASVVAHIVISVAAVELDVAWIQAEIANQGPDGPYDMDFVFMMGMLMRLVLINVVLLPIDILGLRLKYLRWKESQAQESDEAAS